MKSFYFSDIKNSLLHICTAKCNVPGLLRMSCSALLSHLGLVGLKNLGHGVLKVDKINCFLDCLSSN